MKVARLAAILALASVSAACAPVSVSHYQSARPLGKGNVQFGGGGHIQKAGEYGTDRDNADGQNVSSHHALNLPVDVEMHYGVGERTEVMGQLYFTGGKVGARHTWLDSPGMKAAVGVYGGFFTGDVVVTAGNSETTYAVNGTYLDVPLTFSAHLGDYFAVYGGPVFTAFNAQAKVTEKDNGAIVDVVRRNATYVHPGAFVGLCVGRTIQISPGITFYMEDETYPVESFASGGIYAYPFLGLTIATGQDRHRPNPNPAEPMGSP